MKFLAVVTTLAFLGGCATGSVTVTGTPRDPIAVTNVHVYAEPPADYEVIALLESAHSPDLFVTASPSPRPAAIMVKNCHVEHESVAKLRPPH